MKKVTVGCKSNCPYKVNGYCGRGAIVIDSLGMCSVLWRNGQQKIMYADEDYPTHAVDVDLAPAFRDVIEESEVNDLGDGTVRGDEPCNGSDPKHKQTIEKSNVQEVEGKESGEGCRR